MKDKNQIFAGAHVSIAGGFFKAIEEGTQIGCTAIQIFTKSNRQWNSKPISQEDAQKFIAAQKNSDIKIIAAHASYLINLGSSNQETQTKSFHALIDEVERCHQLQIPYLVLHPGTAELEKKELALEKTGNYINQVLDKTSHTSVTILVENMAGQGTSIGSSFEELAAIIFQIKNKKRIGICFDTCHAFVAGYDFTSQEGYTQMFKKFDTTLGFEYLKMFHMNDSKKGLNSRIDRHENIGQGQIPLQAFSFIMNDPRFLSIPKILETPKDETDSIKNDKHNLETLLKLIQ